MHFLQVWSRKEKNGRECHGVMGLIWTFGDNVTCNSGNPSKAWEKTLPDGFKFIVQVASVFPHS